MSLYYLISSLPLLEFDQPPQITADAFLKACREQVGGATADAVEALMSGAPSGHPFVKAWRGKDTLLRNAVARARARGAGVDPERWLRPVQEAPDAYLERLVEDAFLQPDPFRMERMLDKARWAILEEMQGLNLMDAKAVLAYAVKLSLAWRWANLDAGRGQEAFGRLTLLPDGLITV